MSLCSELGGFVGVCVKIVHQLFFSCLLEEELLSIGGKFTGVVTAKYITSGLSELF